MNESVLDRTPHYARDLQIIRGNVDTDVLSRDLFFVPSSPEAPAVPSRLGKKIADFLTPETSRVSPSYRGLIWFLHLNGQRESEAILDKVRGFVAAQPVPESSRLPLPDDVMVRMRRIREAVGYQPIVHDASRVDPSDITSLKAMLGQYIAAANKLLPQHANLPSLTQMRADPAEVCKQKTFNIQEFGALLNGLFVELKDADKKTAKPVKLPMDAARLLAISIYCSLTAEGADSDEDKKYAEQQAVEQACRFAVCATSRKPEDHDRKIMEVVFPITDPNAILLRYAFFNGISTKDDVGVLTRKLAKRPAVDILAAARVLQHGHNSALNDRALQKIQDFIWRLEDIVVEKLAEIATGRQKEAFYDQTAHVIEDFAKWEKLIVPGGEISPHTVKAIAGYHAPDDEAEQQRAKGDIAAITGVVHAIFGVIVEGLRKMSKAKGAARAKAGAKAAGAGKAAKAAGKAAAGAAKHHPKTPH